MMQFVLLVAVVVFSLGTALATASVILRLMFMLMSKMR